MTITTSYGSWLNHTGTESPELYVNAVFNGEGTEGFDMAAIMADFRIAVQKVLPHGVALCGSEFLGPAYAKDNAPLGPWIESIDLMEIIERHHVNR